MNAIENWRGPKSYVFPDDAWYVIPIAAYAERTTIKVFPSSKRRMSRFDKYREAWDFFRPGEDNKREGMASVMP